METLSWGRVAVKETICISKGKKFKLGDAVRKKEAALA